MGAGASRHDGHRPPQRPTPGGRQLDTFRHRGDGRARLPAGDCGRDRRASGGGRSVRGLFAWHLPARLVRRACGCRQVCAVGGAAAGHGRGRCRDGRWWQRPGHAGVSPGHRPHAGACQGRWHGRRWAGQCGPHRPHRRLCPAWRRSRLPDHHVWRRLAQRLAPGGALWRRARRVADQPLCLCHSGRRARPGGG